MNQGDAAGVTLSFCIIFHPPTNYSIPGNVNYSMQ